MPYGDFENWDDLYERLRGSEFNFTQHIIFQSRLPTRREFTEQVKTNARDQFQSTHELSIGGSTYTITVSRAIPDDTVMLLSKEIQEAIAAACDAHLDNILWGGETDPAEQEKVITLQDLEEAMQRIRQMETEALLGRIKAQMEADGLGYVNDLRWGVAMRFGFGVAPYPMRVFPDIAP